MDDERRHAQAGRGLGDVDVVERGERSRRAFRTRADALEVVPPAVLLGGAFGQVLVGEELAEACLLYTSPSPRDS